MFTNLCENAHRPLDLQLLLRLDSSQLNAQMLGGDSRVSLFLLLNRSRDVLLFTDLQCAPCLFKIGGKSISNFFQIYRHLLVVSRFFFLSVIFQKREWYLQSTEIR